jgi:regulator of cell morphogenesis and NO signaling
MEITSTLSSIALSSQAAVFVFEKYDFDYCCKGQQTLEDACRTAQVSASDILKEIRNTEESETTSVFRPWLWDSPMLISYIVQNHHRFLRHSLPLLKTSILRVATKHGERFPETYTLAEIIEDLCDGLLAHLDEEEAVVFSPQVQSLSYEELKPMIDNLDSEHQHVGTLLLKLRDVSHRFTPPPEACTTHRTSYRLLREVVQDTMHHVFLENSVLFPKLLREKLG